MKLSKHRPVPSDDRRAARSAEQGKYLNPELYGKPKADAIGFRKAPGLLRHPAERPVAPGTMSPQERSKR